MIIKGTSRGNPKQLAAHLLRADTNERIQILELNSPTDDLGTTFRDWQLLTAATEGSKGLYHANISPANGYTMTEEQWIHAADVLAEKLGLSQQPRTIILHEKEGREHIHVVWQRTDTDTMTLVSDSMNYPAHEAASLALEKEFGHELVPGKHAKRDREKQPDFPRSETNHAEWQIAERTGLDPEERNARIQALKAASDGAQAFKTALEEAGYILARGDRGYLIVDEQGDHFTLARELKEKTAQVNAFMAAIPLDTLPALEQAKAQAKTRQQETPQQPHEPTAPQPHISTPAPQPQEAPDKLTAQEIASLTKAVNDRLANDLRKYRELEQLEIKQLAYVLELDIKEKLDNQSAMQKAERDIFFRKLNERGTDDWFKKLADRLNKQGAAQERQARQQKIDALFDRQRIDRETLIQTLRQEKQQEIADLKDRQAQRLREVKAQADADIKRFVQEEEHAKRILAAQREQEELKKTIKPPDPPKHSL